MAQIGSTQWHNPPPEHGEAERHAHALIHPALIAQGFDLVGQVELHALRLLHLRIEFAQPCGGFKLERFDALTRHVVIEQRPRRGAADGLEASPGSHQPGATDSGCGTEIRVQPKNGSTGHDAWWCAERRRGPALLAMETRLTATNFFDRGILWRDVSTTNTSS